MTIWDGLIWGGTALTLAGLVALAWCIVSVARAKARSLDDTAMRAVMRRVVVVNMAALAASVFGLMFVVLGIIVLRFLGKAQSLASEQGSIASGQIVGDVAQGAVELRGALIEPCVWITERERRLQRRAA